VIFCHFVLPIFAAEKVLRQHNHDFPLKTIDYIDVHAPQLQGRLEVFLPSNNVIRCDLPTTQRFPLRKPVYPYEYHATYAAGFPVAIPIYGVAGGYNKAMQFENGKVGVRVIIGKEVYIEESYLFAPLGSVQTTPEVLQAKDTRTIMSLHISSIPGTNGFIIKAMNNNRDSDYLAELAYRQFRKATGDRNAQPRL
jgi:hypothetical protein